MFYADLTREKMLSLFPRGGRWCEVGVFSGFFSRKIVELVAPDALHLVDVWSWVYYDWDNPPESELQSMEGFKAWMKGLVPDYDGGHPDRFLDRFHADLVEWSAREKRCAITVHRSLSVKAAKEFEDGYLDVAYVDADHHYDSVLADLVAYAPKVKDGGVIVCDDFLEDLSRSDGLYGTIDAINTFTKRTEFKCLFITGFGEAQCVLYRTVSPFVDELLSNLLNSGAFIIELNDVLLSRFVQRTITTALTSRNVPSFA